MNAAQGESPPEPIHRRSVQTPSRLRLLWWSVVSVVAAGAVYFLTSADRIFRLSDGTVQTRIYFAGMHIAVAASENVMAPLRINSMLASQAPDLVVAPRRPLASFHPSPSTSAGRMITLCKTLRDLLEYRNATQAEVDDAWRLVIADPTEESVMGLIERLLEQSK